MPDATGKTLGIQTVIISTYRNPLRSGHATPKILKTTHLHLLRQCLRHPAAHAAGVCARVICRWTWYLSAVLLVAIAIAVTFLRFWIPSLGERKAELEAFLSEKSARPVQIERLDAYWQGMYPQLRAQGLSLRSADGTKALIRLEEVRLRLSWTPLLFGKLVFNELTLVRPVLQVTRLADGRIALADIVPANDKKVAEGGIFLGWLMRQSEIQIEGGELHWVDLQTADAPLRITQINLNLRNSGDRHQFAGSARLPERISKDVKIVADLKGVPIKDPEWQGKLYLHAVDLNIGNLPRILLERLPPGLTGRLNTQLWTEWKQNRLQNAEGFIGVGALKVPVPGMKVPLEVKELRGTLAWDGDADGWELGLDDLRVTFKDEPWLVGKAEVWADKKRDVTGIRVSRVRLDELMRLVNVMESKAKPLEIVRRVQPAGEIRDLFVRLKGPWSSIEQFSLEAQVVNASFLPYRKFPGIWGLSGRLSLTKTGGKFLLNTRRGMVDYPPWFDRPIPVDYADGRVTWEKRGDHWWVSGEKLRVGNEDGRGTGDLEVRFPIDRSQSPFLKLRADFRDGNGSHADRYYPVKKMSPKTLEWLKHSVISGSVTGGNVYYEGKVREFPFNKQDGKFEVVAHVSNGVVDYAPGWPRVENAEADLLFNKTEMLITGHKGKLHGLDLDSIVVHIEDLKDPKPIVTVRGKLSGRFDEVVDFLERGPLFGNKESAAPGMSGSGEGVLDLSIDIPLKDPKATTVAGQYNFLNSELRVTKGVVLSGIKGSVEFTESKFSSGPIAATIFGGSATLSVSTPTPGRNPMVIIRGSGRAEAKALGGALGEGLVAQLQGGADWSGRLRVHEGAVGLRLESDLVGVSSNFPAPLNKEAQTPMRLVLDSRYGPGGPQRLAFTVGDRVNGKLVFKRKNDARVVSRGQIVVGSGRAALPDTPGLRFSARLPDLDLDAWFDHFKASTTADGFLSDSFTHVSADVQSLRLFGRTFHDVDLNGARRADRWYGTVNSDEAAGRIELVWAEADRAVSFDLDRLIWPVAAENKGSEAAKTKSDPQKFPRLKIKSRTFQYGDLQLGSLHLETEPMDDGCRIKRLHLQKEDMELIADGSWLNIGGRQTSQYNVRFSSSDVGKTSASLGFPGRVRGGSAELNGTLSWLGGPGDFALSKLAADLKIRVKRGRFLNVNPGAGRLFGLFNIEALTRRLTLDFSDIFSKGYAFDKIKGRFIVKKENAYTRDLLLQGPAADIKIVGRSGIVAEDYDLTMTVMPQVGGNLPIVGGALGGPAAGVVIFVMQRLFKRQLNNFVKYHYAVTGSWDNPVVVKTDARTKEG